MCTVSFVNTGNSFILTSNRDEQVTRPALPPQWYIINGKELEFPKDPRAGGTWFAADKFSNVAILLNGAAESHIAKQTYIRSRGLIVLDILSDALPLDQWSTINLTGVEPFTLVLYSDGTLHQLQWDGITKSNLPLRTDKNYIWSSSTLYSKKIQLKRIDKFELFTSENKFVDEDKILRFHTQSHSDNTEDSFIINRNEILKTLSITQQIIASGNSVMRYYDIKNALLTCKEQTI